MKKKESNIVETYCEKCDEEMIFEDEKCTECGSPVPVPLPGNDLKDFVLALGPYTALLAAARNMCEKKNSAALEELKQAVNAIDQKGGQA